MLINCGIAICISGLGYHKCIPANHHRQPLYTMRVCQTCFIHRINNIHSCVIIEELLRWRMHDCVCKEIKVSEIRMIICACEAPILIAECAQSHIARSQFGVTTDWREFDRMHAVSSDILVGPSNRNALKHNNSRLSRMNGKILSASMYSPSLHRQIHSSWPYYIFE